MARVLVAVVAACVAAASAASAEPRGLRVCAAAGPYWPTMTLALDGPVAWVACKEQSRLVRVDTRTGRTLKPVRLDAPAIAVTTGYGSVWAVDSSAMLYRIDHAGRVRKRIPLLTQAAYNVWAGGGSIWVADDQAAAVVRISPKTNRIVARIAVGDGPADIVFTPTRAWVMSHRDRVLHRIALDTNAVTKLATLGGVDTAPERMVYAGGSLWITGRGADLMKVDPDTGAVQSTIEIGASGIDVATAGRDLWVPTRSDEVDRSGFPTMAVLRHVSSTGNAVDFYTPRGRLDVHGIAVGRGRLWLADNTAGRLYSFPLLCGDLAQLDALGRRPTPTAAQLHAYVDGAAQAAEAARANAGGAQRRDAATLADFYRQLLKSAAGSDYDPQRLDPAPLLAKTHADAAAGRLGRWSGGVCPRAYDVL